MVGSIDDCSEIFAIHVVNSGIVVMHVLLDDSNLMKCCLEKVPYTEIEENAILLKNLSLNAP